MIRKVIALSLCTTTFLSLTACGTSNAGRADTTQLEQRIEELEKENAELRAQLDEEPSGVEAPAPENSQTPTPESSQTPTSDEPQAIEIGSTYTIPDLCEFTVNFSELKKEVLPPSPDSFYTYYKEEDGMTYIDLSISMKNLRTTARDADEFGSVKAICGAGYEYDGFSTIEESGGGDFTYTNITSIAPLATGVIHYIISIPNELANDSAVPISLNITILDSAYTLKMR